VGVVLTTRRAAVLALLALVASCGGPKFDAPTWNAPAPAVVPEGVTSLSVGAAGWDGGMMITGSNQTVPQPMTSTDGHTWNQALLEGMSGSAHGSLAGFGAAGYVLGGTADGPAVWRTETGATWTRTRLPGAMRDDLHLSIAAGPRGVVVAGYDRRSGADTSFDGYRVWFSPDGKAFDQTAVIPVPQVVEGVAPRVTATHDGFLLEGRGTGLVLFSSSDGLGWQDITAGLPNAMLDAVSRSGGTTVAVSTWFDTDDTGPGLTAWYRHDGDSTWTTGSIDLGKLPDLAVAPRIRQRVLAVQAWGDNGFIAVGGTEQSPRSGAAWTSPDGREWTRMSVRDNGFNQVPMLVAALANGTLIGMDTSVEGPKLATWTPRSG
jgi:hypothetical protein